MSIQITETTTAQTTINLLGVNAGQGRQSDLTIRPLGNGAFELQLTATTHLGAGRAAETSEAIVVTARDAARLDAYLVKTGDNSGPTISLGKGKIKIRSRSFDHNVDLAGGLWASLSHGDLEQIAQLLKG